jgi:hypothetical protein
VVALGCIETQANFSGLNQPSESHGGSRQTMCLKRKFGGYSVKKKMSKNKISKREYSPADAAARPHGLVEAAKQISEEERRSKNTVVDYLAKLGRPTVDEYVALNWCGDKTFEDLEGEELAEVLDLIEEGELACPTEMPTKVVQ